MALLILSQNSQAKFSKVYPSKQQGFVLIWVLLLSAFTLLTLTNYAQAQQGRVEIELNNTEQIRLAFLAEALWMEIGQQLAEHQEVKAHLLVVPENTELHITVMPEPCPKMANLQPYESCYQVDIELQGRRGVRWVQKQSFWAEPGCGAVWLLDEFN